MILIYFAGEKEQAVGYEIRRREGGIIYIMGFKERGGRRGIFQSLIKFKQ